MKNSFYEMIGIDKKEWEIQSKYLSDDILSFLENYDVNGGDDSKYEKLVKIIRRTLSSKDFFQHFPYCSEEDLLESLHSLSSDIVDLFIRGYGEDLKNPICRANLTKGEKLKLDKNFAVVDKKVIRLMVNKYGSLNIFELLRKYTSDEIFEFFLKLSDKDQALIKKAYGDNLDDSSGFFKLSAEDKQKVYGIIFKRIVKPIENSKSSKNERKKTLKSFSRKPHKKAKRKAVRPHFVPKERSKIPFSSGIISRRKYTELDLSDEIWYMKKLKLSYCDSSDIDDETQKLYFDYYCEVTPRFKAKYDAASDLEKEKLFEEAIEDSREWRDAFLKNNMLLILKAMSSSNYVYVTDISEEEFRQEGFIALMNAAEKFDITKGLKFSTYAYPAIERKMRRYHDTNWSVLHVKVDFSRQYRIVRGVYSRLYQEYHRYPTVEEISLDDDISMANISKEVIENVLKYDSEVSNAKSLDDYAYYDDDLTINDILSDGNDFTFDFESKEQLKFLKRLIEESNFSANQILVLYLRHGLIDGICYSNKEIAERLGISVDRVKQIYATTCEKFKSNFNLVQALTGKKIVNDSENIVYSSEIWQDLMMNLEEKNFNIFYMVYVQGMDVGEVSRLLDIPYDEVFKISITTLRTVKHIVKNQDDKSKVLTWV